MKKKILVTGTSVEARILEPLTAAGYTVHNPTHLLSEDELKHELSDACAYILGGDEYASEVALSRASGLKVIAFLGVGYESFMDSRAATKMGIPITNTPGTLTNSVAEFTVGQILNARRKLTLYTNNYMNGRTNTETKQHDVAGAAVAVVGMGSIGTRIAEIMKFGFGCTIKYFNRHRKTEAEARLGAEWLPLHDLMQWGEIIVIMTPGNDSTHGLIGITEFEKISPKARRLLVNTSRASIVAPNALLDALSTERIGTAVFDGFYEDDVPERAPLIAFGQERLLVTGHIASLTVNARDGMGIKAVQSVLNILAGKGDCHVVNGISETGQNDLQA